VDGEHTTTAPKCNLIFCGEALICVIECDNEWERRENSQHVCYGCTMCTDETKVQVGGRFKYEVPPPSANLHGFVPPGHTFPCPILNDMILVILVFMEDIWSTVIKYVKE
jgi:hypothetical protein